MRLYCCSINELRDAASYDAASLKIDPVRAEKLHQLRNEGDKKRSICAGLLLNFALFQYLEKDGNAVLSGQEEIQVQELKLQELLTVPRQNYIYQQKKQGKPFLSDFPRFHFSLSHSGEYVLCACAPFEIGADLQSKERSVKENLVKKVLTRREYAEYMLLEAEKQKDAFYSAWTIKESCCKLTGKGLALGFQNMEIFSNNRVQLLTQEQEVCVKIKPWKEDYWLAVSYFKDGE